MTLRSIDFSQGAVLILRGKGKKERALSLVDPNDTSGGVTLKLLADWIDMRASVRNTAHTNSLWVSMKGTPLSRDELRKILGPICQQAGLDKNRPPHTFRRSWFTESYIADPNSIRVLAARMGWSDRSHHMIDIYTRGADVDLARTARVPSLSARWHASPPVRSRALPAPRPLPAKRQPAVSADALHALVAAVKTDPEVRRALLQALNGAA